MGTFGKRPNVNAVYVECVINKQARCFSPIFT